MVKIKSLREVAFVDLVNLVNEIFQDYPIPINWDVLNLRLDMRENSLSDELSFVFYEDMKPVGFVITGLRRDRGRIDAMGVVKEKRGKGLAQQILNHALEILKWRGAEKVVLEVAAEDRRAVRFYEKNGFRDVRELHTMALKRNSVKSHKKAYFAKMDSKWAHRAAIEAELSLGRKPNWQREPLTILLSNGRYNIEKVVLKGGEGFLIWGKAKDSSFIVDMAPLVNSRIYKDLIEASIYHIFEETPFDVITITSVPKNDPLYNALRTSGFEELFTQKEMCFKLPS